MGSLSGEIGTSPTTPGARPTYSIYTKLPGLRNDPALLTNSSASLPRQTSVPNTTSTSSIRTAHFAPKADASSLAPNKPPVPPKPTKLLSASSHTAASSASSEKNGAKGSPSQVNESNSIIANVDGVVVDPSSLDADFPEAPTALGTFTESVTKSTFTETVTTRVTNNVLSPDEEPIVDTKPRVVARQSIPANGFQRKSTIATKASSRSAT
jgi:hypothetical protein